MSMDRPTWADVQRAAHAFAEALHTAGYLPDGLTFHVSKGNTTYNYNGGLYWSTTEPNRQDILDSAPAVIPGGHDLPIRARAAYEDVTSRTRMVYDLRRMKADRS